MKQLMALFVMTLMISACGKGGPPKGVPPGGFAVNVVAIEAKRQEIQDQISIVGSLAANEAIDVKAEIEGMVKEIHFQEGQRVKKGDILLTLDDTKWRASLEQAKANWEIAQTTYQRLKTLIDQGAVSQQEVDQAGAELAAKKAQLDLIQAQFDDTVIKASFDGVVGDRRISVGQVIGREVVITQLINDNPMKVEFNVPERYLSRLAIDQAVSLTVAAFENEVFTGKVFFVDPQVNQDTRTALVKATINNDEGKLRRGMFAKLDLTIEIKAEAVVIPESALIPQAEMVFVYVVDAENKAQMRPVTVGIRMENNVEILSGVDAGDKVITQGHQKIGPGSLVNMSEG